MPGSRLPLPVARDLHLEPERVGEQAGDTEPATVDGKRIVDDDTERTAHRADRTTDTSVPAALIRRPRNTG